MAYINKKKLTDKEAENIFGGGSPFGDGDGNHFYGKGGKKIICPACGCSSNLSYKGGLNFRCNDCGKEFTFQPWASRNTLCIDKLGFHPITMPQTGFE